jgi:hypothetical protein
MKYCKESRRRKVLHTIKRRKANWIGHKILPRNCLLKHVLEGKTDGKTEGDRRTRKKTYVAAG